MEPNVGFIGLGSMGAPIARNLMQAGYRLNVYNRTSAKAAPLVDQGATLAQNAAEVAEPGGIVFTMLSDDSAVEQVCCEVPSFIQNLGPGGIHVSLSTIAPATAQKLAAHHAKHGVSYVAAPVFGRPDAAAAKKLWVCASGPSVAQERVNPMLTAIGQGIFNFGQEVAAANVVKLCGNFLIASAIESMGEALVLAEKNGVDPKAVAEMFGNTLFACPVYKGYGAQIAEQRFEPVGFRLALGLKDINLTLQTAAAAAVPMPVASLLHDRWLSAIAKGRADMDWTAATLGIAEDAGLKLDSSRKASTGKD